MCMLHSVEGVSETSLNRTDPVSTYPESTPTTLHVTFCTTVYPASALEFSDPQVLTGQVARQLDGYYGPISVTVGMGFPFAGQTFQSIYVSPHSILLSALYSEIL